MSANTTLEALRRRFANSIQKTDSCWLWTGRAAKSGYGYLGCRLAHHVSWLLANGPVPDGLDVCHHCDTPSCVRPDHLFVGTPKDNMQDAARKGRLSVVTKTCKRCGFVGRGCEHNPLPVEDEVYMTVRQAAADAGVVTATVYLWAEAKKFPTRKVGGTTLIERKEWRKFRKASAS